MLYADSNKEVGQSSHPGTPVTSSGLVANFSFRYLASLKLYRFRDTEGNCVLAYPHWNRPTNWK